MDLWVSSGCTTCWMDMQSAKVATKLQSLLNWERCKILRWLGYMLTTKTSTTRAAYLITEGYHLPLSNEKSQLILPLVIQLRKLHAMDFSANR